MPASFFGIRGSAPASPAAENKERTKSPSTRSPVGTALQSLGKKLEPTGFRYSFPHFVKGRTFGPVTPNVKGSKPPPQPPSSAGSPATTQGAEKVMRNNFQQLIGVFHPSDKSLPPPVMEDACTETQFLQAVNQLWPEGTAGLKAVVMREALTALGDYDPPSNEKFAHAAMLLTALHALGFTRFGAYDFLRAFNGTGAPSQNLFRLQQSLAASVLGRETLCRLMRRHDEDDASKASYCDQFSICADMHAAGLQVENFRTVEDVVEMVKNHSMAGRFRIDEPIGTVHDAPLQLLAQALLHARRVAGEEDASVNRETRVAMAHVDSMQRDAYVAWEKGGFKTSGPGTDFNNFCRYLFKSLTYIDRVEHGDRTLSNIGKDVRRYFMNLVGKERSPLTQTRWGTMGANRWGVHDEQCQYASFVNHAIDPIRSQLEIELNRATPGTDDFYRRLAQAAALGVWQDNRDINGRTAVKVTAEQVKTKAFESHGGADGERIEQAFLAAFPKSRTTVHEGRNPSRTLRLQTLLELSNRLVRDTPPAHAAQGPLSDDNELADLRTRGCVLRMLATRTEAEQAELERINWRLLDQIETLVEKARKIKRKEKPVDLSLFRWKDVLNLVLQQQARPGPNRDSAKAVLDQLGGGRDESLTTWHDGMTGGLNLLLNVATKSGGVVSPGASGLGGERVVFQYGDTLTGTEIFIGKQASLEGGVTLGGAGGVVLPGDVGIAAGFGGVFGGGGAMRGTGASIVAPLQEPGWGEKGQLLIDFLFQQQALPRVPDAPLAHRRPANASQMWAAFAQRFWNDPGIKVRYVKESGTSTGVSASVGAAVRGNVGNVNIGPAAIGSLSHARGTYKRTPNADGGVAPTGVHTSTTAVNFTAALAMGDPPIPFNNPMAPAGIIVQPLAGVDVYKIISSTLGLARLGRDRLGNFIPWQCQYNVGYQTSEKLVQHVNAYRDKWETRLAEVRELEMSDARQVLDDALRELQEVRGGNLQFGEFSIMKEDATNKLSALDARLRTLLGVTDEYASHLPLSDNARDECNRIQHRMQQLLADPNSRDPVALWAYESNQMDKTLGYTLIGPVLARRSGVAAGRVPFLFVGPRPDPHPANPAAEVVKANKIAEGLRNSAKHDEGILITTGCLDNLDEVGIGSTVIVHGEVSPGDIGRFAAELKLKGAKLILTHPAQHHQPPPVARSITGCAYYQAPPTAASSIAITENTASMAIETNVLMATLKETLGPARCGMGVGVPETEDPNSRLSTAALHYGVGPYDRRRQQSAPVAAGGQ